VRLQFITSFLPYIINYQDITYMIYISAKYDANHTIFQAYRAIFVL